MTGEHDSTCDDRRAIQTKYAALDRVLSQKTNLY